MAVRWRCDDGQCSFAGCQKKGEPKSVMFSDGIRPGGDLTELDGSNEPRLPLRKSGRSAKKVERSSMPEGAGNHCFSTRLASTCIDRRHFHFREGFAETC